MNSRERRELRGYVGSGIVFGFVIMLLLFLSSVEIPDSNNDTFKLIVGALVATIGASVFVFIGKDDQQVAELQRRNDSLETKVDSLISQKDQLEGMIIKMQDDLIDRVFLKAAIDFDGKK